MTRVGSGQLARAPNPGCDHYWTRDDQYTRQCIRCGQYAPVEEDPDT